MPSPFPGMDPFLEHPAFFPDLHDSMVTYLREAVQVQLPEPYYAAIGSQVWVELSKRYIEPDVDVLLPEMHPSARYESNGGVAVASSVRTDPVVVHVPHDEHRETFVEIYTRQGHERLVTSIEVLSLANKTPGEHGRDLYLRKQREVVYSKTNLVEIDLLRGGEHSTAVPLDRVLAATGPFDYHVSIHRFDNLQDFFIYPILLAQRLPQIAIPLLPSDPDIAIDLQAVFNRCYDTGPYRRRVQYQKEMLIPLLKAEQWEWANELVQKR